MRGWVGIAACALTALSVTACQHSPDETAAQTAMMTKPVLARTATPTDTQVAQIGIAPATASGLTASTQIGASDTPQLTVEQLKTYVDRCGPDARMAPPSDLDCSEMSLRVKRVLRADDAVTAALVTLDRLGRSDMPGASSVVAGGLLPPGTDLTQPDEEEDNLVDALEANGLVLTPGVIVAATGGNP